MRVAADHEALVGAANRFVAFFRELDETFVERQDLMAQLALALLAREHVLITGPPGTAKSKLANAVLARIVCEHTGKPSLYARQFTEATVQTDLAGPIDFKTLMETGRTEHFTDEGILGATHAFLDEIFDGRDMLLRSTLNLLNERELKQGTKISTGNIECAVMTSNRYLVEVLESERLVAFVDRIAFLGFVPRGFASASALTDVLRREMLGTGNQPARARLTVQDVDLLQGAVDRVPVDESLCASVAALAQSFEAGLASARKADPAFIPSRYVSTRGIVRLARLLRAICIHDWAFRDRKRPLEARRQDLAGLRLGLTLCGPGTTESATLLEKETDPRERRQLGIVRLERTIFERCLAELPAPPPAPAWPEEAPAISKGAKKGKAAAPPLEEINPGDLAGKPIADLVSLAQRLSATAARRAGEGSAHLTTLLDLVLQELLDRVLRAGLRPGREEMRDPVDTVASLAALSDDIDQYLAHRGTARWLRGRGLELIGGIIALGPSPFAAGERHAQAAAGDLEALNSVIDVHLHRLESLAATRNALRQAGADELDPGGGDERWREGVERAAQRLAPDLAAGFAAATRRTIAAVPGVGLERRLDVMDPALALLRRAADRLTALGGDGPSFFRRVVAAPFEQLLGDTLSARPATSRAELASALAQDLATMAHAGVDRLVPAVKVAGWIAETLVRASPAAATFWASAGETVDFRRYRELRERMPPGTMSYILVDLLARLPEVRGVESDPDHIVAQVAALVRELPEELRGSLITHDQAYVEAPILLLERWWESLSLDLPPDPVAALARLEESGFFSITHHECALARFDLEARLVEQLCEGADLAPVRARAAALAARSTELVDRLAAARLETA